MVKRGQTGIALVILGVIAIIAVIGLVLLFTRASNTQGAALLDLSIGNAYGGGQNPGEIGIAPTYPTAEYDRSSGGGYQIRAPVREVPGYGPIYPTAVIDTKGSRTPAFIVSGKYDGYRTGYASLSDVYGCERDLNMAGVPVPHDLFNCYQLPDKGPTAGGEVTGFYPPVSSAEPRPPKEDLGNLGGTMMCYANSVGAEQTSPYNSEDLIRQNIITKLIDNSAGVEKYDWKTTNVNGVTVPVCWISAKAFPFPQ